MITSVKIKDNTKTPFEYASDIEARGRRAGSRGLRRIHQ